MFWHNVEVVASDTLGVPDIQLIEPIGEGGYGRVFKAYNERLNRTVAIKVFNGVVDDAGREQFESECRLHGPLSNHDNVVTVHNAGYTAGGSPYLEMELVAEGTLADRLRAEGRLPWREVVQRFIPVCGAIQAAHSQDVIHRDIKPANILISPSGLKLADFGIACFGGADSPEHAVSWLHAPPEAVDNNRDSRGDIYSLASSMYELIAGTAPFWSEEMDSLDTLVARIVHDPAPELDTMLAPSWLRQFLTQALSKDPAARPQSAIAFRMALEDGLALSSEEAQRVSPFEGSRQVIIPPSENWSEDPRPSLELHFEGVDPWSSTVAAAEPIAISLPSVADDFGPVASPSAGWLRRIPRLTEPSWRFPRLALVAAASLGVLGLVVGAGLAIKALVDRGDQAIIEATAGAEYSFVPTVMADDVVVARRWFLSGDGGELRGLVTISNEGDQRFEGEHFEVIPASVAPDLGDVSFDPIPSELLDTPPAVRFAGLSLSPKEQVEIGYRIDLPTAGDGSLDRLVSLVADQRQAQTTFAAASGTVEHREVELMVMRLSPQRLELTPGSTDVVSLEAIMSDGRPALDAVTDSIVWRSGNPSIAKVTGEGLVEAVAPGTTTVEVQIGAKRASVLVVVKGIEQVAGPTVTSASPSPSARSGPPLPPEVEPTEPELESPLVSDPGPASESTPPPSEATAPVAEPSPKGEPESVVVEESTSPSVESTVDETTEVTVKDLTTQTSRPSTTVKSSTTAKPSTTKKPPTTKKPTTTKKPPTSTETPSSVETPTSTKTPTSVETSTSAVKTTLGLPAFGPLAVGESKPGQVTLSPDDPDATIVVTSTSGAGVAVSGRTLTFAPVEPGQYQVTVVATLSDGSKVDKTATYVAEPAVDEETGQTEELQAQTSGSSNESG